MKRLLYLVLVLAIVLVGCSPKVPTPTEPVTPPPPVKETTLVVGRSGIAGEFVHGFGGSEFDGWVRTLLEGYETYSITPQGEMVLNPTVVKKLTTETHSDGNKTYTFELYDDLKWNDGSLVTAADYVFHVLWRASPAWLAAGANSIVGDGVLGYRAYFKGETDRFKGVNLIDDYKFALTLDASKLPYFWETSYVTFKPSPMAAWAPGAKIDVNSEGAKIDGIDLMKAAADVAATERFAPTITSGPFNFISFENKTVTTKMNEHFKGTFEGKKPQLTYVIIRDINMTLSVDHVISGEVDLVSNVIQGDPIDKAYAAANVDVNFYNRNGFGGVYFHTDFPPTNDKNVRHALAHLMDRDEIIANVLGGYGTATNGYYGLAQWMYQENKAIIDAFPHFSRNIAKANEFLDMSEWKFEADGKTPFDASKASAAGTYLRHNARRQKLVINHFGTENNRVTDNVDIQFKANAPFVGLEFTLALGDFPTLTGYRLLNNVDPAKRVYISFNAATTFDVAFDPYYQFHSDQYGTRLNTERVNDPKMDELVENMRRLDPTQKAEWSAAWLEFQKYWYEYLPAIPMYSNEIYEVFSNKVKGVNATPFLHWADVICDIYKVD